jgi:hypothetical protein
MAAFSFQTLYGRALTGGVKQRSEPSNLVVSVVGDYDRPHRPGGAAGAGFSDANTAFAPMNNSPDQADRVGRVQTM